MSIQINNPPAASTVGSIASVTSINTLASVTSVYGVKSVESVASITSINTLATITSVGAVGTIGTVASITSMSTLAYLTSVGTVGSLVKTFVNKTIDYSAAAETALVAAIAGKRIRVYAYSVIGASTASNVISFKDDAGGTTVWKIPLGSVYGANLATQAPSYLFASASGGTLAMAASVATSVTVSIAYWEE